MHPSSPNVSVGARRTPRILFELLAFLALVVATAFSLRPLQRDLFVRMTELRDRALERADAALGRRIEYRSLGPSVFGNLDLRGVSIFRPDGTIQATVSRVRIGYSLFALLGGKGLGAVSGIRLDRPDVRLDAALDADLIRRFSPAGPSGRRGLELPGGLVRVREGSFSWAEGSSTLGLTSLSIDLSHSGGGRYEAKVRSDAEAKGGGKFSPFGVLNASAALTARTDDAFRSASATVFVSVLSGDRGSMRPQTVSVDYSGGNVEIRKIRDRSPFDLSARYSQSDRAWSADLKMDGAGPRNLLFFRGPWKKYDAWNAATATGEVSAVLAADGRLSYRFDIQAGLPDGLPVPSGRILARGRGDAGSVDLERAVFSSERGNLEFVGRVGFSPASGGGRLSILGWNLGGDAKLNAEMAVETEGNAATFFADKFSIGDLELSAVDASLVFTADSVDFSASALRFVETGEFGAARIGRFSAEGTVSAGRRLADFSLSLDSFPLRDAAEAVIPFLPESAASKVGGALGPLGNLTVTTEVFVTSDFKELSFSAPQVVAAWGGGIDAFLVASASGTAGSLSLEDISFVWKGGTVGGSLSLDFSDPDDIPFRAKVAYRETEYGFDGVVLEGRSLSLRGDYGLAVNLNRSEDMGFSGSVSAEALPLPIGDFRLSATVEASFRWLGVRAWNAEIARLELENVGGELERPLRIGLSGTADQGGLKAKSLSVDDGLGALSGDARLSWGSSFSSPKGEVSLSDGVGTETYRLEGGWEEGTADFRILFSRARLGRLPAEALAAGVATGELRGHWSGPQSFELGWRIAESAAIVRGTELGASFSGALDQDSLLIENARVTYAGFLVEVPRLSVDRLASSAEAVVRARGALSGRDTEIAADLGLSFSPIARWSDFSVALEALTASVRVSKARIGTLSAEGPFALALGKTKDEIYANGGPGDAFHLRTAAGGAFYASLASPSPVRGTVVGSIQGGLIDAGANDLYIDFPALWKLLQVKSIEFSGGIATGSIRVTGPIGDPAFSGRARASGFRLHVPEWVEGELGPVATDIVFDGNQFAFGPAPITGKANAGTVTGRFYLDRWIPSRFRMDIAIPRTSPLPAIVNVSGIAAKGSASGALSLSREDETLAVSGKLALESTTITFQSRGDSAEAAPAAVPVKVALELTTGRKVEFVWPTTDFPIVRAYADSGDTLKVAFDGLSGRFSLAGDVALRGGEVFYFQRSFYLRQGSMVFNENEVRFDPKLSLRAEIRDRNEAGPITIALVVDESPLSAFVPRLEADPPLSQIDILAMLGQNLVGIDAATGEARLQEALLSASSDVLAQFNVIRVFERNVRDVLNLDMFSVRTQVLQNAVLEASGLRSQPVDRIGGLGNYFDNTTVYMGKFVGSDLFLQAMLSLQMDESKVANAFGGLTLEPDIGLEMKTPLFLLRWSFLPLHPENLFIDDHSFTLSWRWSF